MHGRWRRERKNKHVAKAEMGDGVIAVERIAVNDQDTRTKSMRHTSSGLFRRRMSTPWTDPIIDIEGGLSPHNVTHTLTWHIFRYPMIRQKFVHVHTGILSCVISGTLDCFTPLFKSSRSVALLPCVPGEPRIA